MDEKDRSFIDLINKLITNRNTYILNDVFGKFWSISDTKAFSKMELSLDTNLYDIEFADLNIELPNYWKQVNNYFKRLNPSQNKKIIEYLEKYINNGYSISEYMLNIILINSSKLKENKRIEYYEKFLKSIYKNEFYNFNINNEDLKSLWFINKMKNKEDVYLEEVRDQIFRFKGVLFDRLLETLTNMDKNIMYYDYAYLIENTSINLLEYVLKNNKLELEETQKIKFLKEKIVQRIYANLALNGVNISQGILKSIIDNVDEYKFYGVEMNNFLNRFSQKKPSNENYYIDGIHSIPDIVINNESEYIPLPKLNNRSIIDAFISKLDEAMDDPKSIDVGFDSYYQNQEFSKRLTKNEPWIKNKSNVIYLLNQLIQEKNFFDRFESSISKIICYGINIGSINVSFIEQYFLVNKHVDNNIFDIYDESIFESLIKNGMEEKSQELLFRIDLCKLETNYGEKKDASEYVILNNFINTDLGRYVYVLKKLPKCINETKKQRLITDINELDDKYKNYLKGMFILFFDSDNIDFSNMNTFMGYSHNYNMPIDSAYLKNFSGLISDTFIKNKFIDEYTMRNFCLVLVMTINPLERLHGINIDSSENMNIIFKNILTMFFVSNNSNGYRGNWVKFFLQTGNYFNILMSFIMNNLTEISMNNLKSLNNLFRQNIVENDIKVKITQFSYIHNVMNLNDEKINELIDFFLIILNNDLFDKRTFFVRSIEQFLSELKKGGFLSQINYVINELNDFLIPSDIDKLKNEFL